MSALLFLHIRRASARSKRWLRDDAVELMAGVAGVVRNLEFHVSFVSFRFVWLIVCSLCLILCFVFFSHLRASLNDEWQLSSRTNVIAAAADACMIDMINILVRKLITRRVCVCVCVLCVWCCNYYYYIFFFTKTRLLSIASFDKTHTNTHTHTHSLTRWRCPLCLSCRRQSPIRRYSLASSATATTCVDVAAARST